MPNPECTSPPLSPLMAIKRLDAATAALAVAMKRIETKVDALQDATDAVGQAIAAVREAVGELKEAIVGTNGGDA